MNGRRLGRHTRRVPVSVIAVSVLAMLATSLAVARTHAQGLRESASGAGVAPVATGARNMVSNGSFESGGAAFAPWIFRHDVAASIAVETSGAPDGQRAARITIGAPSPSSWLVQLREEGLRLRAGTSYTVSLWAKASVSRTLDARVQSPVLPFATLVTRNLDVTTQWQPFVFRYTSPVDVANAFIGFNMARIPGDVWLDDVSVSTTEMITNGGFEMCRRRCRRGRGATTSARRSLGTRR